MSALLYSLLFVHIATSLLLLFSMRRNAARHVLQPLNRKKAADISSLPTVSICIPARNEDHALQDCLSGVISTDYPKLEVIVLDDCSQDQTSQIIRSFAHDGVRFVHTHEVPEDWLGKNYAYQTLLEQAHGTYIVFMSVDTRISTDSITRLIDHIEEQKLTMVSVLPQRHSRHLLSSILAPLRIFWQLAWPFKTDVPVGTALWVVRRDTLVQSDLLSRVKSTVFPERKIARHFAAQQTYHFLSAQSSLGVWYEKKWSSQLHTSTRLWSPLLGHHLLSIILVAALHLGIFIFPVIALLYSLFALTSIFVLSLVAFILLCILLIVYLRLLGLSIKLSLAGVLLPVYLGFQEVALILYSYYRYRRGEVEWKGRNVCYPHRFHTPD